MRIYEELEKEANQRKEKQEMQLELITSHTSQMKADLGGAAQSETDSNQNAITSRQLAEIEALEKDVKLRLR